MKDYQGEVCNKCKTGSYQRIGIGKYKCSFCDDILKVNLKLEIEPLEHFPSRAGEKKRFKNSKLYYYIIRIKIIFSKIGRWFS